MSAREVCAVAGIAPIATLPPRDAWALAGNACSPLLVCEFACAVAREVMLQFHDPIRLRTAWLYRSGLIPIPPPAPAHHFLFPEVLIHPTN